MRLIRSWTRLEKLENGKWVYRALRLSSSKKPMLYLANKKIICFSYILMLCEMIFYPIAIFSRIIFKNNSLSYTACFFIVFFLIFLVRFVFFDKYASNKLSKFK